MRLGVLCAFAFVSLLLLPASVLRAEKIPTPPAQLRKQATHVVQGTVKAVYTRTSREGGYRLSRHVAEVEVLEIEKGEGLEKGGLVYVRYWERGWVGPGKPPPGTNGHMGLPAEGETLRLYLVRNGYDGFGTTQDGGFNVYGRNGFERIAEGDG